MLYSWTRHFTLTVLLHPGVKIGTSEFSPGGNLLMVLHLMHGEVKILVTSCYRNWDNLKLWPDVLLGSYVHFYYLFYHWFFQVPQCVKDLSPSAWNPPPGNRRLAG